MSKITIIKEPGIFLDGIVKVLNEKLGEHSVSKCNPDQQNSFYEAAQESDLLIIDMNIKVDNSDLIYHCLKNDIKIVAWTSDLRSDRLNELFKLDLQGYFYNGMESDELVFAIKSILNGKQYIHPDLSPFLLYNYIKVTSKELKRPEKVLTGREWEVLEKIVEGQNNESIASSLFITSTTVNNHVRSILRKLNVENRTKAALFAIRNNWIAV
ncbi:helix-turn-helix domain-containing protein [Virgibacillus sp. DJP39]|uniref:helix-turn-helix domain-containing protein n=1 Tax=Virgibacillus sp. DJP39 TaxID=3409790 RepID=UPI003BB51B10